MAMMKHMNDGRAPIKNMPVSKHSFANIKRAMIEVKLAMTRKIFKM